MKSFSFMVMGDAHLDRKFKSSMTGASDRLAAFDAAIELARQRSLNYIFITGNLFDSPTPSSSVLKHVTNSLASLPARIIIAPGNCDPSTVGSCYKAPVWPSNVFIFPSGEINYIEFNDRFRGASDRDYVISGGKESGRKGIRIYGAAFEGHFCRESLLVSGQGRTPRLSSSYINVLAMHGFVSQDGKSNFNPIPTDILRECGFDLCAIGGEPLCSRKGNIIVPGSLCASGFKEAGECGVYVGEISDSGYLTTDFIQVSPLKYETIVFDVSGRENLSPVSLASDILKLSNIANCTRIELTGELLFDENIDVDALGTHLKDRFPLVEVVDKTMKRADLSLFNYEKTFRGMFTAAIWESVKSAREQSRKSGSVGYNERNYEQAVNFGLKIIDNMSLKGKYSSLVDDMGKQSADKGKENKSGNDLDQSGGIDQGNDEEVKKENDVEPDAAEDQTTEFSLDNDDDLISVIEPVDQEEKNGGTEAFTKAEENETPASSGKEASEGSESVSKKEDPQDEFEFDFTIDLNAPLDDAGEGGEPQL